MKKIIKLFRFSVIGLLVFCVFALVGRFVFQFLWGFNILDKNDYNTLYNFWEKGGSFKTFKDITFIVSLIAFPIVWFVASKKLYKFGLGKFLLLPIIAVYRKATKPKTLEVEHVSIKNIGVKDKTIDEIISEKIRNNENGGSANTPLDIRKQISAKIEENVKQ
ncbi:MAG: hypothetical protein IJE43_17595 [Alphaproteobacteria bacterium]|nr:hypothetical protein [Alphaproteobacteria bacterium]